MNIDCILIQPLDHSMDGRLFGRSEEQRERQKEINVKSLVRCEEERKQLKSCFRSSWFGWCQSEQRAFWNCFNKVTRLHVRMRHMVNKNIELSEKYMYVSACVNLMCMCMCV